MSAIVTPKTEDMWLAMVLQELEEDKEEEEALKLEAPPFFSEFDAIASGVISCNYCPFNDNCCFPEDDCRLFPSE